MEEEKEYLPINLDNCRTCASIEEAIDPLLTPEVRAIMEELRSNTIVSRTLARMRVQSGLSQTEMARNCGFTQPRISGIERATDDKLQLSVIRMYCAILRKPFKAVLADGTKLQVPVPTDYSLPGRRKPGKTGKTGGKPVTA